MTDLTALVEQYAAAIPNLNMDGEEQEEYSTMLPMLQNQVETGEGRSPSWSSAECPNRHWRQAR